MLIYFISSTDCGDVMWHLELFSFWNLSIYNSMRMTSDWEQLLVSDSQHCRCQPTLSAEDRNRSGFWKKYCFWNTSWTKSRNQIVLSVLIFVTPFSFTALWHCLQSYFKFQYDHCVKQKNIWFYCVLMSRNSEPGVHDASKMGIWAIHWIIEVKIT